MTDLSGPIPGPQPSAETATGRNVVICCDGTSNEFGRKNTNVVRLVQCLTRDTDAQSIYYDPGVGTLPDPNRITRLGKRWTKTIGLAFGYGLTAKVMEAYAYLMEHWENNDRVFIFGFSRGAYTARVLAGLLHTFGLMPRGANNLLPYVIKNYRELSDRSGQNQMRNLEKTYAEFRRTFARPASGPADQERHFPVHFLGVWDTVSTVGWVWDPKSFRYTAYNPSVTYARHAMAIDERRIFFRQNRLAIFRDHEEKAGTVGPKGLRRQIECWFPGSHSDVGGGHLPEEDQLWPLSFAWMLEEAQKAGLQVDAARRQAVFATITSPKIWTGLQHESLEGPWTAAEYFPAVRWRRIGGEWHQQLEIGRGTPRKIFSGELLHRSTLLRLREQAVSLPNGRTGPYIPPNLCVKFITTLRETPDPLPENEFFTYRPGNCGCAACKGLTVPAR